MDVFCTLLFEYNGEVTSVTTVADGTGGWPDIISAAENATRTAVNKLESQLQEDSRGRASSR